MKLINKGLILVVVVFVFSFANKALASNITVNDSSATISQNGLCSINEAIINANSNNQTGSVDCVAGNGLDTILINNDIVFTNFYPNGFNDSSGTPFITDSLIVNGQGHTLSRNSSLPFRFFHVTTSPISLSLKNLRMVGGYGYSGGAVFVTAMNSLSIDNCQFLQNSSDIEGGAIYANGLPNGFTIDNSTFEQNVSSLGGVILANEADLTIKKSKFISNNSTWLYGGSIAVSYGYLSVKESTFENNTGGTIYTFGGAGLNANVPVHIDNSTFNNNSNTQGASVIKSESTMDLNIFNSTFSGNTSSSGSAISLYDYDSKISVGFSTFLENNSNTNEGVIKIFWNPTSAFIENNIFANNTGGECNWGLLNINSVNNLSSNGTCGQVVATGVDQNLANNGGLTKTHKLIVGSNAIDTAIVGVPGVKFKCPKFDQRYISRPFDGDNDGVAKCDIGAYEYSKKVQISTGSL